MPAYVTAEPDERPQLQRLSDLLASIPGRLGAVLRRVVQFLEPDPRLVVPVPGSAIVHETLGKVGPLFHGTAAGFLKRILREGLKPAAETGIRLWAPHLMPKRPAVYLTRDPLAAARYAQFTAEKTGAPAGVVLKVREVPTEPLVADEDVALLYALARERRPELAERLPRRVRSWKWSFRLPGEWAEELATEAGELAARVEGLGTAAYRGTVPPEAIEVVEVLPRERFAKSVAPEALASRWRRAARERERILAILRALREQKPRAWWLE